jgi:hypothetical protein
LRRSNPPLCALTSFLGAFSHHSVIRRKQASTHGQIQDMTKFKRVRLMGELQMEAWPFELSREK